MIAIGMSVGTFVFGRSLGHDAIFVADLFDDVELSGCAGFVAFDMVAGDDLSGPEERNIMTTGEHPLASMTRSTPARVSEVNCEVRRDRWFCSPSRGIQGSWSRGGGGDT